MARLSMCEQDRDKYGGPEWLGLNLEKFVDDTPAGELEQIEDLTNVVVMWAVENPAAARSVRLWLWLGLRKAGVEIPWAEFTPRTLRVEWEPGDVVPPAGDPSSEGGSETS